jgi:hypothetical protein
MFLEFTELSFAAFGYRIVTPIAPLMRQVIGSQEVTALKPPKYGIKR